MSKEFADLKITKEEDLQRRSILICIGDNGKEILSVEENGDILVHEKLIENNLEITNGLRDVVEYWQESQAKLKQQLQVEKDHNKVMKEALEFYGDIQNWFQIEDREFSDAILDKGYFSRIVLEQIKTK